MKVTLGSNPDRSNIFLGLKKSLIFPSDDMAFLLIIWPFFQQRKIHTAIQKVERQDKMDCVEFWFFKLEQRFFKITQINSILVKMKIVLEIQF